MWCQDSIENWSILWQMQRVDGINDCSRRVARIVLVGRQPVGPFMFSIRRLEIRLDVTENSPKAFRLRTSHPLYETRVVIACVVSWRSLKARFWQWALLLAAFVQLITVVHLFSKSWWLYYLFGICSSCIHDTGLRHVAFTPANYCVFFVLFFALKNLLETLMGLINADNIFSQLLCSDTVFISEQIQMKMWNAVASYLSSQLNLLLRYYSHFNGGGCD